MKRGVDSVSQRLLRCILLVGILCSATPGWANLPFAGQHYPNGAEDFLTGALPPPGFYLKNYFVMVQKDRLMGTVPGVGDDERAPVDLEVDAKAIVPRIIWMTPWEVLGANLGMYALLPLYWVDAESAALRIDSDDSGLGDIYFGPMLDWHFSPNFHLGVGLEFVAPAGDYQEDDPASQIFSKNHWTIEPLVAMTYLWHGFDVSAKVMYDFNMKNDAYVLGTPGGPVEGDLKPGQELHVDYGISYATTEALRFGISGYAYWQTTKDEFHSNVTGTVKGRKGRIYSVGPTIKYWPNQGRFSATLKHTWEFGAENIPEGQATWLNLIWAF